VANKLHHLVWLDVPTRHTHNTVISKTTLSAQSTVVRSTTIGAARTSGVLIKLNTLCFWVHVKLTYRIVSYKTELQN